MNSHYIINAVILNLFYQGKCSISFFSQIEENSQIYGRCDILYYIIYMVYPTRTDTHTHTHIDFG